MAIPISRLPLKTVFDPFTPPPTAAVAHQYESWQTPLRTSEDPIRVVNQPGHGFEVGDAVYKTALTAEYARAVADSDFDVSQAIGIVTNVGTGANIDKFVVQFGGVATIGGVTGGKYEAGLTIGKIYYLSSITDGLSTTTRPSEGSIIKATFVAISETEAVVIDDRADFSQTSVTITKSSDETISGFSVGDIVYRNGSQFSKAATTSWAELAGVGIVVSATADNLRVVFSGLVEIGGVSGGLYEAGLTPGSLYYLSETTPGLCAADKTPSDAEMFLPAFVAVTSSKAVFFGNGIKRIPSLNHLEFTQVSPTLKVGMAVYYDGAAWQPGDYSSISTSNTAGIISKKSGNNYRVSFCGVIYNITGADTATYVHSSLTPGAVYYLRGSGTSDVGVPSGYSNISKALFVSIGTSTAVLLQEAAMAITDPLKTPVDIWYTTPGPATWTAPAGVTRASIVTVGGGGAGGAGAGSSMSMPAKGGGGGASGSVAMATVEVTPSSSYYVYVGDGGAISDNGWPTVADIKNVIYNPGHGKPSAFGTFTAIAGRSGNITKLVADGGCSGQRSTETIPAAVGGFSGSACDSDPTNKCATYSAELHNPLLPAGTYVLGVYNSAAGTFANAGGDSPSSGKAAGGTAPYVSGTSQFGAGGAGGTGVNGATQEPGLSGCVLVRYMPP